MNSPGAKQKVRPMELPVRDGIPNTTIPADQRRVPFSLNDTDIEEHPRLRKAHAGLIAYYTKPINLDRSSNSKMSASTVTSYEKTAKDFLGFQHNLLGVEMKDLTIVSAAHGPTIIKYLAFRFSRTGSPYTRIKFVVNLKKVTEFVSTRITEPEEQHITFRLIEDLGKLSSQLRSTAPMRTTASVRNVGTPSYATLSAAVNTRTASILQRVVDLRARHPSGSINTASAAAVSLAWDLHDLLLLHLAIGTMLPPGRNLAYQLLTLVGVDGFVSDGPHQAHSCALGPPDCVDDKCLGNYIQRMPDGNYQLCYSHHKTVRTTRAPIGPVILTKDAHLEHPIIPVLNVGHANIAMLNNIFDWSHIALVTNFDTGGMETHDDADRYRAFRTRAADGRPFQTTTGASMSVTIKRLAKHLLNVPHVTNNVLRHTFVTTMSGGRGDGPSDGRGRLTPEEAIGASKLMGNSVRTWTKSYDDCISLRQSNAGTCAEIVHVFYWIIMNVSAADVSIHLHMCK
jgi:hypothetical protein